MCFALCLILSLALHAYLAWRFLSSRVLSVPAKLERTTIELSFSEREDEKAPPMDLESLATAAMAQTERPLETDILLSYVPSPETIPLEFTPPEPPQPKFETEITVEMVAAPDQAAVEGALPEAETIIRPKYPRSSRKRGEEGEVLLKIEVDVAGIVKTAVVIDSSGFPELDLAAVNAALGAKFKPAIKEGSPIPSIVDLKFDFRLK